MSELNEKIETFHSAIDGYANEFDAINGRLSTAFVLYKRRAAQHVPQSEAGLYGPALKHEEALEDLVILAEDGTAALRRCLNALAKAIAETMPDIETHSLADPAVRRQVLALTGGKCTYCDAVLSEVPIEGQSVKLFVEHVVPVSKGGPNHLVNYVPSCGSCNSAKGDMHVLHFVRNVQPRRQEAFVTDSASIVSIVRAGE